MASKLDVPKEVVDVNAMQRTLRATTIDLVPVDSSDKQDWKTITILNLNWPSTTVIAKHLRVVVNSETYPWDSGRAKPWALSLTKANHGLRWIHDLSCEKNDITGACRDKVLLA